MKNDEGSAVGLVTADPSRRSGYEMDRLRTLVGYSLAHRGAELLAQHLQCDLSIVPEVASDIHDGHDALADLALDLVSFAQRRRQLPGFMHRRSYDL